ncbi:MAG: Xaa-Pro peptidase family protein, partial [Candidatus Diapherotrites archaeon]|nr:Xaa-Pro peptidase family protein [Candidatus Diapherotrites archaeon]
WLLEMQEKIKELFNSIDAQTVLLKAPDPNFYYFSQLQAEHFAGNVLILRKGAKPLLLTTRFYSLPADAKKHLVAVQVEDRKHSLKILRDNLTGKRIGLNYGFVTKNYFAGLKKQLKGKKFFDVSKQLAAVRAIKTNAELGKIKKAVKITEQVMHGIPALFKKGMSEKQLANAIEMGLREKADNVVAFPPIVASGANGAVPHHLPGGKKIGKGFLLIDVGAKYGNYCADLSRTFFVGKAGEKEKRLYEKVFAVQQQAIGLMKPNAKCSEIFSFAAKQLEKETGFPLIHGLGHGLGVEAHDFPGGFVESSNESLKQGMVFTVEPAVYGKFGGIRIEDNIVVTKKGAARLSKVPGRLIELR